MREQGAGLQATATAGGRFGAGGAGGQEARATQLDVHASTTPELPPLFRSPPLPKPARAAGAHLQASLVGRGAWRHIQHQHALQPHLPQRLQMEAAEGRGDASSRLQLLAGMEAGSLNSCDLPPFNCSGTTTRGPIHASRRHRLAGAAQHHLPIQNAATWHPPVAARW